MCGPDNYRTFTGKNLYQKLCLALDTMFNSPRCILQGVIECILLGSLGCTLLCSLVYMLLAAFVSMLRECPNSKNTIGCRSRTS